MKNIYATISLENAKKDKIIKGTAADDAPGRNLPRSWARNLSRSYTDLQQEYQLRKEYFQKHYEADYDDDDDDDGSLDWDNDDDQEHRRRSSNTASSSTMEKMGTSSTRMQTSLDDNDYEYYSSDQDPKNVLFRHLLREWCVVTDDDVGSTRGDGDEEGTSGSSLSTPSSTTTTSSHQWPKKWSPNEEGYYEHGKIKQVALMKFPSQIRQSTHHHHGGGGLSVRDMIRREFRAPTVEERLKAEEEKEEEDRVNEKEERSKCDSNTTTTTTDLKGPSLPSFKELTSTTIKSPPTSYYPPSSYIDNDIRIQTAFYTLMELNRKLAWAEAIGFPPLTSSSSSSSSSLMQQSRRDEMKWKRLVQAAKGVSLFPTKPTMTAAGQKQTILSNANMTLSSSSDSSILQCGTYLIAHPLMTGYFAKSVIVILDHAEEEVNNKLQTSEGGEVEGEKSGSTSSSGRGGGGDDRSGGTYGLIINRLALQPEKVEFSNQRQYLELMLRRRQEMGEKHDKENPEISLSPPPCASSILRSISLIQAINADDLPESVQSAFGDVPIREGGPINLSLQMIHRKSFLEGQVNTNDSTGKKECRPASNRIGGTILGYDHDRSKKDAEDAIYFGGDVIKASHAVLGGESDRDDFSFVIGAACWAPGQLQHEIERGCWLPFRGPASMALTGMCEHNEVSIPSLCKTSNDCESAAESKETTKLSLFPPRPSHPPTGALQEQTTGGQTVTRRPVGDLWLSIMCALGEGEAELAYMMLDQTNVMHSLGDACDNFDR